MTCALNDRKLNYFYDEWTAFKESFNNEEVAAYEWIKRTLKGMSLGCIYKEAYRKHEPYYMAIYEVAKKILNKRKEYGKRRRRNKAVKRWIRKRRRKDILHD